MIIKLCFSFFFLLFSLGVFANEKKSLPFKIDKHIELYNNNIYIINNKNELVKLNESGNVIWKKVESDIPFKSFKIKFDKIFALNKNNNLIVLDVHYGISEWKNSKVKLKELLITYPYVFYLSQNEKIGKLDFLNGQLFWEKNKNIKKFYLVENYIILHKNKKLVFIDKNSGHKVKEIDFSEKNIDFYRINQNIVLLNNKIKNVFYELNIVTNEIKKITFPLKNIEHFDVIKGLVVLFNKKHVMSYDLLNTNIIWQIPIDEDQEWTKSNTSILIANAEKGAIYNIESGKRRKIIHRPKDVKILKKWGFISTKMNEILYQEDKLWILNDKTTLNSN